MTTKVYMDELERFLDKLNGDVSWIGRLKSQVACRSGRLGWSWMRVSNNDMIRLLIKGFDYSEVEYD